MGVPPYFDIIQIGGTATKSTFKGDGEDLAGLVEEADTKAYWQRQYAFDFGSCMLADSERSEALQHRRPARLSRPTLR